jgi:hypothetical protein
VRNLTIARRPPRYTYPAAEARETRTREIPCPADGEWVAMRFRPGTFMPQFPIVRLIAA